MSYLLTADWHLDLYTSLSDHLQGGRTSRLQYIVDALKWMADEAHDAGCLNAIIAGDIFHKRTEIDVAVLDAAAEVIAHYVQHFDAIYLVVGNHDSYLRTPEVNSLSQFSDRATITVVDKLMTTDDGKFVMVPWDDSPVTMRDRLKRAAKKKAKYLVTHALIRGSVPSTSPKQLDAADLKASKYSHVFLGDVHTPLEVSKKVQYIGAPIQHNYGDADSMRGFWILDTEGDELEYVENDLSPRFHVFKEKAVAETAMAQQDIEELDYVRLCTGDAEFDAAFVKKAAGETQLSRIESTSVALDAVAPRIDLQMDDGHGAVFEKYCEHKDVPEDDRADYIEFAMEVIEEARD